MVRFGLAINSGKLLQPATVQSLQTPQRLRSGQETPYGLGWDLYNADVAGEQRRVVGHDGELMGGLTSSFMIFPGDGVVIAVASNTAFGDTHAIGVKIAQAFADGRK